MLHGADCFSSAGHTGQCCTCEPVLATGRLPSQASTNSSEVNLSMGYHFSIASGGWGSGTRRGQGGAGPAVEGRSITRQGLASGALAASDTPYRAFRLRIY